ncbi:MAG: DoxX family protein [Chloroflexi bacterium]|jgi:uncharacterized membrane protein YphA (DoxX/SURF4 family)|nr:DoxX family protein [Chloroflexota bacterium]
MNIALWAVQIIIGLLFFMAGATKVSRPIPALARSMTWVNSFSPPFVRFIGAAELLGGLGLIIPAATGILSWLTPLAAAGLTIIMLGAVVYHLRHREINIAPVTLLLSALALFVLVGRWVILPL